MTEQTQATEKTEVTKLPELADGEKGQVSIGFTNNGVAICLPASYVDAINDSPYLEQQVEDFGTMVEAIEKRTGKHFARPVMLHAGDNPLAFATSMTDRGSLEDVFGKDTVKKLNPNLSKDKKASAPLLNFPIAALLEDSPFDMKIIEGIVLHELGHAATHDVLKYEGDTMLWHESLAKISQICQFVTKHPEIAAPVTQKMGGNAAYLEKADELFTRIDTEVSELMQMYASDGKISAESMLDHLYYDAEFMERYKTVANLGTGKTLKEFHQLHDTTVDLACTMFKEFNLSPEGFVKLSNKPYLTFDPIEKANPEHAATLNQFGGFQLIANHAGEFLADDFATRNHSAPTSYLSALPNHGSSHSHPAPARRVNRADVLDTTRIGQLVEDGAIDEEAATKHTNAVTRPQPKPKPDMSQQKAFLEALLKTSKQGESFVKREGQRPTDCSIGRK